MSWLDGMTKNWAELTPNDQDPRLRPIVLPIPPAEALLQVAQMIANRKRWDVVSTEPETGTIRATHQTILWRFVDDVLIRCEPDPQGTRIQARSQSRIGKGDLGQNRRNLRDLTKALGKGCWRITDD